MENLQPRHRHSTNVTKSILSNTTVMNMIVETIFSPDANDHYAPQSTEWPDDTIFATWYLPKSTESNFPPVLIEVQHTVDNDFILNLMDSSLSTYEQHKKVAPVILTFVISAVKYQVSKRTNPDKKLPFLLRYICDPWAQACYFVNGKSLQSGSTLHLPPLVALSHFLIGQHPSLSDNPFNADPTIQLLYSIAERAAKKPEGDMLQLCHQTESTMTQALSTLLEEVPDMVRWRRAKKILENGKRASQSFKRKYETVLNSDDVSSLKTPSDKKINTTANNTNVRVTRSRR